MRTIRGYLLFLVIVAVFAALFIFPIFQTLKTAFVGIVPPGQTGEFTFGYIAAVFKDPALRAGLFNSMILAIGTTFLCMCIAIPLSVLATKYDFLGKGIFSGLLLVPLILPPFVGAIGMRQILGRFGVLTAVAQDAGWVGAGQPVDWLAWRMVGVMVVMALSLYPILYLNLTATLSNIDPAMQQAAANLGAGRWRIFRKITLPLMRPGLFAGGTIVLIWSFTELGTPLMFDFNTVAPVQVFQRLGQVDGNPIPYALVVVMLISSVLLYVTGKLVLGRGQNAAVTKASTQNSAKKLGIFKSIPVLLPFVLISGLALLPHVAVILMSISKTGAWYQSALPTIFTGDHYSNALTHPLAVPSVKNSIMYASISTVIDIVLGLMIAFLIVRSKLPRFFRATIDSLAMLPLAVPGLVMAFGYLGSALQMRTWALGKATAWSNVLTNVPDHPIASWAIKGYNGMATLFDVQNNPMFLLVIAYAMRRLPYVVRSGVAGLEQTPVDLELAAQNIGASKWTTMKRITIPLIGANLIAGGLLAFAFAMLEVSDSLILAQKENSWPITKAIYELFQRLGDGPYIASALGVWAMILLTLTILSASTLLGKKMGAIFRV